MTNVGSSNRVDYLLKAVQVASRSSCHSRPVGCVVVKDFKIIGVGCNGTHLPIEHCERIEQGVPSGEKLHLCPCSHAEVQAMLDLNISEAKDSTVYVTTMPCNDCMNLLVGKQIKEVVYLTSYPQPLAESIAEGKVKLTQGESEAAVLMYSDLVKSKCHANRVGDILQVPATS